MERISRSSLRFRTADLFPVQLDEPKTQAVPRLRSAPEHQIADISLRSQALRRNAGLRHAGRDQIGNDFLEGHVLHFTAIALERKCVPIDSYSAGPYMSESEEQMSMGDRLKQARKTRKLSQMRLAKMTGVSQSTISDIERGRNAGSTESAKLAAALGVSALWLSTGRGPRHEDAPIRPVMPQKQINTSLLIQCMRAVTAFQQQTGSKLDDEDLLRLACRLYEQSQGEPDRSAQELLGYLITLNDLLDSSH